MIKKLLLLGGYLVLIATVLFGVIFSLLIIFLITGFNNIVVTIHQEKQDALLIG
ncbi:MAG: hypothetical protein LBB45_07595 [Methanobrevibacter sp.]|jgi:ABC-type transport system involved in multi-copper enzyme maturation permease subunit|nr:hypothetical protein [Candidatus Methanovirga basalitermitum]